MSNKEGIALLYGKNPQREQIKSLLTRDSVLQKGEIYDYTAPWCTTKADDYKAWKTSKLETAQVKQDALKSNITLGSYVGSAMSSVQKTDYNQKCAAKVASYKPSNNINIVDMDPRYQTDKTTSTSSYRDEFHKDTVLSHVRTADSKGNTNYLRSTHFTLGSDQPSLKTEAQSAYSGQSTLAANKSVATERAQQDKRTNHVFRNGDYNMTQQPEPKSVFAVSYKGAGIPSTQKGYNHVTNSRTNVKTDELNELSTKLYSYLRDKFQNQRDPTQVNLRQAFACFDKKRTGFISKESMTKVLKRLVSGADLSSVEEIVVMFDKNHDGKIDYLEFESFLNQKLEKVEQEDSLYTDTYKPSLLEGATSLKPVDGAYQINTHFRLGESGGNYQSLYKSTFGEQALGYQKPSIAKPPPPSQMLPVEPDHMASGSSIQRADYTTCTMTSSAERVATLRQNKALHENVSFSLGSSLEQDRELRMKSMTSSSYQPKQLPLVSQRTKGFQSKWNHLKTEDALPELTAGPVISEHADNYNATVTAVAHKEFVSNKELRQVRVSDEKNSHLSFGNDSNLGHRSEMATKFSRPLVNQECPAAGITGGPIAEHKHMNHSEMENTALSDPSVKSLQDAIKQTILEKYYNPRDPLNVNLQKAFREFDKNNTGKITVTGLREACKRLQLPVSDAALHRYFLCLDKNRDGSIDYNEFADELGIHIQHISNKGLTSVMKSDYTPIHERGSAGMEGGKEPKADVIQPSHYFHLNHSTVTPKTTTQNDFSHPLDQIDWFQTVSSQ